MYNIRLHIQFIWNIQFTYTIYIKFSFAPHLVAGEDPEGVDDLFGGVGVDVLASHEVQEGVELRVARGVGVHDRQDALEVDVALMRQKR